MAIDTTEPRSGPLLSSPHRHQQISPRFVKRRPSLIASTKGTTKPNRGYIAFTNIWKRWLAIYYKNLRWYFPQCSDRTLLIMTLIVSVCIMTVSGYILIWMFQHSECFTREAIVQWKEGDAHTTTRPCESLPYTSLQQQQQKEDNNNDANPTIDPARICLTTLTDSHIGKLQKLARCRNFDQVQTYQNHFHYAQKHGYTSVDGSSFLDTTRPPAWSKIRAVQHLLQEQQCDWVLWLDADAVIMNSDIPLESLLPASSEIDLIVTKDRRFTANSGVWLIRNSPFGRQFLDDWWNMKSFVRPKGLSLSGDNEAFGSLIRKHLNIQKYSTSQQIQDALAKQTNIAMPSRCNLNSFGVFVKTSAVRKQPQPEQVLQQQQQDDVPEWYLSQDFYHDGDFIAHASGIDQKAVGVELLLHRAR